MGNISSKSGLYGAGSSSTGSGLSITPGQGEINIGPFGGFGWLENYLKGSIDFGGWVFNGTSTPGRTVKSPVGLGSSSTTNDAVQINGGTLATHGIYQDANSSPATASTTWTLSVWARSVTGSITVKLRLDSGNETGTEQSFNVGTSWQRISVTQSFSAASTGTVRSHIINGTSNVCLWGAQLNKSDKPGIFYPTAGNNYGVFGSVGHYGWVLGSGEAEGSGRISTGGVTIFSGTEATKAALTIMNFSSNYYQTILNVYGSGYGHVGAISAGFDGLEFTSYDETRFNATTSTHGITFGESTAAVSVINGVSTRAILRLTQTSGQTEKSIRLFNQSGSTELFFVDKDGALGFDKTVPNPGTTGAITINKPAGGVRLAAGQSSVVVTNSLVTTSTHILATVATNDSTLKSVNVVPAAGSFTITGNAAATGEVLIRWVIIQ
jgi:hypothetical protein